MEPTPISSPDASDTDDPAANRSNTILAVIKIALFIPTLIAFLIAVIPPTYFTADNVWCTGSMADDCYKFMIFPIVWSGLMLLLLAVSLMAVFFEFCLKPNVGWIHGSVELIVGAVWIAVAVQIQNGRSAMGNSHIYLPRDAAKGEIVPAPTTWLVAAIFAGILVAAHFAEAGFVFYLSATRARPCQA